MHHSFIFACNLNHKPMKHVMNWGAILGFVLIAVSLAFYLMGMTESQAATWISYAAIAVVLYFGIKVRRDNSGGLLTYGQGLGTGTGIAFFASILVAFYTFVFFSFIDPDMLEEMLIRTEDEIYSQGMPESHVDMAMEMTRKFMTPGPMAVVVVFSYTIVGFIASLILSAILKKEGDPFQADTLDSDIS